MVRGHVFTEVTILMLAVPKGEHESRDLEGLFFCVDLAVHTGHWTFQQLVVMNYEKCGSKLLPSQAGRTPLKLGCPSLPSDQKI